MPLVMVVETYDYGNGVASTLVVVATRSLPIARWSFWSSVVSSRDELQVYDGFLGCDVWVGVKHCVISERSLMRLVRVMVIGNISQLGYLVMDLGSLTSVLRVETTFSNLGHPALSAICICEMRSAKAELQIAWMLFDTSTILAVQHHVITKNPRISVSHDKHRTWYLHIKNVREEDKGKYMCQINTITSKTQYGYLHVVVVCRVGGLGGCFSSRRSNQRARLIVSTGLLAPRSTNTRKTCHNSLPRLSLCLCPFTSNVGKLTSYTDAGAALSSRGNANSWKRVDVSASMHVLLARSKDGPLVLASRRDFFRIVINNYEVALWFNSNIRKLPPVWDKDDEEEDDKDRQESFNAHMV
ncbi:hypothetical protein WN48_02545 [Eufriesea mexicana]|uniref:Ig-like domain-containing protein n=1 Tax=Eufriesea mexicana TaxID=516756 RepID=A0A310SG98_9HYME|nr:hypothetical protein WN48_02545 [Eufriesea mexicana]